MYKSLKNILIICLSSVIIFNCGTKKSIPSSTAIEEPVLPGKEIIVPTYEQEYVSFGQKKWVDSIYNQMSLEDKIGQLFMVAAYSNKDSIHFNAIDKLISKYKIGGLIFFQGGPGRQARLTNRFQSKSKIPLFIGNDAEWGLSMRLDSTYRYPWNMTLGAIQNLRLVEEVGKQMGAQCNRLGVHFNFAPVLDINTNPKNPIIGFRSFGEDKINVTDHAIALMKGVQSQQVFSTGKHFPGHGDTSTDSHKGLPTVDFSAERLDEVELYPYKRLFKEGLSSVMVAHLNVPCLELRANCPSSLSYNIVTNILQTQLGFKGLIFTDALNMKGASNYKTPGDIDLDAFTAGNDILLFPENVPLAVEKIKKAYQDTTISQKRLAFSVKKILKYKFVANLNHYKPIIYNDLNNDLNPVSTDALQYQLYENAITVLKNEQEILPIKDLNKNKIAYVKLGDDSNSAFVSTIKKYAEVTEIPNANIDSLNVKLKPFTTVVVGFHKSDKAWKKQDFTDAELLQIQQLAKNNHVILDVFVKPYSLSQIQDFKDIKGLVVSYQNCDISQIVSAELLFGAIEAKGKLPVSINAEFKVNSGLQTKKLNLLGFSTPENVGMNSEILTKIEPIVNKAIENKMTPGAQILVARKGKVIYQKSFGFQTYNKETKVNNETLYDVASVTKMIATLPLIMQFYDQKKINLDTKLGSMLPTFSDSDKAAISFKELLSHYARLQAWIPFYKATLDSLKMPSEKYYSKTLTTTFSKQVAENLYLRNDYHDTIIKKIKDSKLLSKLEYKYSDFTFILMKEYLEKATGERLDNLVNDNFYSKIGMNNTLYNPLKKFSKTDIAPTEIDNYFRYQVLQGYVHDMEAAMEDGVGGHAGIFSNAMDVAKMMQLFLQKGSYGNQTYFSAKTFDDFNTCYYCPEGNRRGLGFDKPQLGKEGPTCGCVSAKSFGHTGFTGTMAWADPETELIYIFLSNRTYPEATTNTLSKANIREDIQKVIQDAIIEK